MIYFCAQKNRSALVLQHQGLNGIDYLEVSDQDGPNGCGTRLVLTMLKDARTLGLTPSQVLVSGGEPVVAMTVLDVLAPTPDTPRAVTVDLAETGDFAPYVLRLVATPRDRRPAGRNRSGACGGQLLVQSRLSDGRSTVCRTRAARRAATPEPDLNYLAKDYDGFRQVMLDRMAVLHPMDRDASVRPGDRARRDPRVRGRSPQLPAGRGGHRGLPRHRAQPDLPAPARQARRLPGRRGQQRARLGLRPGRRGRRAAAGRHPALHAGARAAGDGRARDRAGAHADVWQRRGLRDDAGPVAVPRAERDGLLYLERRELLPRAGRDGSDPRGHADQPRAPERCSSSKRSSAPRRAIPRTPIPRSGGRCGSPRRGARTTRIACWSTR